MTNARYRIRIHPQVGMDLDLIVQLIAGYSGMRTARRILGEIEAAVQALSAAPHKGSIRDEIATVLRAFPAGRRAVVAFVVDEENREVRVIAITYGGNDWHARIKNRR